MNINVLKVESQWVLPTLSFYVDYSKFNFHRPNFVSSFNNEYN